MTVGEMPVGNLCGVGTSGTLGSGSCAQMAQGGARKRSESVGANSLLSGLSLDFLGVTTHHLTFVFPCQEPSTRKENPMELWTERFCLLKFIC